MTMPLNTRDTAPLMRLKIFVPGRVVLDLPEVSSLTVTTPRGVFGLRPRRLDCVMPLVPGLATYDTPREGRIMLALDEGLLVKTGLETVITVRHVITGGAPGHLKQSFEAELREAGEREREIRVALARLESSFVRRLSELGRPR